VNEVLIQAALNWAAQKADFAPDGSLRDICVENASLEDWKLVVAQIFDRDYGARLERRGVVVAVPEDFDSLFDLNLGHRLSFTVGGVSFFCHFFAPTEIELSFAPEQVSKTALRDLLAFMIDLGDATKKLVVMTPENCREGPIFRYDFEQPLLRWTPRARGY
jgi:hypothetical protein